MDKILHYVLVSRLKNKTNDRKFQLEMQVGITLIEKKILTMPIVQTIDMTDALSRWVSEKRKEVNERCSRSKNGKYKS